jgi:hypothetical protein
VIVLERALPTDPAFDAFRAEQLARFPKSTYTVRALVEAAKVKTWRTDEAIRKGKLRAFRYGDARNAQWTVEIDDWIAFRWATSNAHPAEPKPTEPPPQRVARPRRGRPPEKTRGKLRRAS